MLTMHPFSAITQTEPQHTKAYKWASAIIRYEAARRSDKRRFDREYNQDPKDTPTVKFGLQGRSLRPPMWKMFKRESFFNQFLP